MSGHKTIGLAKEKESPENPGALERRVALTPEDVATLIKAGYKVFVEKGAGEGVGFEDAAYSKAGAILEDGDAIYADKDMIIKFKGPATAAIDLMSSGATLFCMAHVQSIPERLEKCQERQITLVGMEKVAESPEATPIATIMSYLAMENALSTIKNHSSFKIVIVGYTDRLQGAIKSAGRSQAASVSVVQADLSSLNQKELDQRTLVFYDSLPLKTPLLRLAKERNAILYNLADSKLSEKEATSQYHVAYPPKELGKRRIECLHETGRAGARYGLSLLASESPLKKQAKKAIAAILGYGNVSQGAIHECYEQGIPKIFILGRRHTNSTTIEPFLKQADIIINGAEPTTDAKRYLVTKQHAKQTLKKGAVVVDLIGGSPTNRSPVENVIECTYLTDPHFVEDEIFFTALWGWPTMGMMRETAIKYSSQILSVLLEKEKLLQGFGQLSPGVRPAIMSGPYDKKNSTN